MSTVDTALPVPSGFPVPHPAGGTSVYIIENSEQLRESQIEQSEVKSGIDQKCEC